MIYCTVCLISVLKIYIIFSNSSLQQTCLVVVSIIMVGIVLVAVSLHDIVM